MTWHWHVTRDMGHGTDMWKSSGACSLDIFGIICNPRNCFYAQLLANLVNFIQLLLQKFCGFCLSKLIKPQKEGYSLWGDQWNRKSVEPTWILPTVKCNGLWQQKHCVFIFDIMHHTTYLACFRVAWAKVWTSWCISLRYLPKKYCDGTSKPGLGKTQRGRRYPTKMAYLNAWQKVWNAGCRTLFHCFKKKCHIAQGFLLIPENKRSIRKGKYIGKDWLWNFVKFSPWNFVKFRVKFHCEISPWNFVTMLALWAKRAPKTVPKTPKPHRADLVAYK